MNLQDEARRRGIWVEDLDDLTLEGADAILADLNGPLARHAMTLPPEDRIEAARYLSTVARVIAFSSLQLPRTPHEQPDRTHQRTPGPGG